MGENMLDYLAEVSWSPYIAGAGIGILACSAFLLSDHPLGCSTGYVKMRGLLERAVRPATFEKNEYYHVIPPAFDWQFFIVPGIIIGAFLSAMLSGSFRFVWVPALWGDTFGYNPLLRIVVAVSGGILLETGARWAGGCTSGHGISGTLQLSCASIVAAVCFFAGGIAMAMLLFRIIGV
jgi:uncharacterized membrane protein YedE/YeeE